VIRKELVKMRIARIACTLLVCLAMTHGLAAQPSNKKTKVTFSGPFEIPNPHTKAGVMTLPAGSYIFTLVDTQADRHIVRVTDMNGKVMSTIMAIGDYRLNASSKTVMYFGESAAGKPVALKSWFYPGDNYGNRFIYPKVKAQEIAAQTNQPVPSYTGADLNKDTPVQLQTPAKTEVAYTPQAVQDVDAKDTAGADGEAVTSASGPAGKLPKTASPLAGYAVTGFMLLAAAWLFRRAGIAMSTN
jgi:hypothetical protein